MEASGSLVQPALSSPATGDVLRRWSSPTFFLSSKWPRFRLCYSLAGRGFFFFLQDLRPCFLPSGQKQLMSSFPF